MHAQNIDQGIVRHYPFNGNSQDFSTFADHASVNGATLTTDRFNQSNSAYAFNGTSNTITFTKDGLTLNEFSYSLWVKLDPDYTVNTLHAPLYFGDPATTDHGIVSGSASNGWTLGSYNTDNTVTNVFSKVTPTASTWHHLVFVRSSTAVIFYINGTLADSTVLTNEKLPKYSGSPSGCIGARFNSWYFKGAIDDVRIYGRVITPQEVNILHQQTVTSAEEMVSQNPVISVFPNPVSVNGVLHIESETETKVGHVKLLDFSGREILVLFDNNTQTMRLNEPCAPGLYTLRLFSEEGLDLLTRPISIR